MPSVQDINNNNKLEDKPPGGLAVLISPHLKKLAQKSPAIQKQFYPSFREHLVSSSSLTDPLLEDKFTKTRGLVHKYQNRVLILLTLTCASYCRFCTRRRMVSDLKKGVLTKKDLDKMAVYLLKHPAVNEVIFSGGDPLTAPLLLEYAIKKMSKLKQIKIIRLHTRVPVSHPKLISPKILQIFQMIKRQPLYLSLHFEHPDELTKETVEAIKKIKKTGAILLSQSVFLKGINDSYPVLLKLFTRLTELGVRPYYIYHCDPVVGIKHFIVPLKKEIEIMTRLRAKLSGISCPVFVIDTPNGSGKVPVPLNFWGFNPHEFKDFAGKLIKTD